MLKGKAQAEQHMARTGSHATKPSAKGYSPLNWGIDVPETLTPRERRDILARRMVYLQGLINQGVRNPAIGREINELGQAISKIRPSLKKLNKETIGYQFMQVAWEQLDERTYKRILDLAIEKVRLLTVANGGEAK